MHTLIPDLLQPGNFLQMPKQILQIQISSFGIKIYFSSRNKQTRDCCKADILVLFISYLSLHFTKWVVCVIGKTLEEECFVSLYKEEFEGLLGNSCWQFVSFASSEIWKHLTHVPSLYTNQGTEFSQGLSLIHLHCWHSKNIIRLLERAQNWCHSIMRVFKVLNALAGHPGCTYLSASGRRQGCKTQAVQVVTWTWVFLLLFCLTLLQGFFHCLLMSYQYIQI